MHKALGSVPSTLKKKKKKKKGPLKMLRQVRLGEGNCNMEPQRSRTQNIYFCKVIKKKNRKRVNKMLQAVKRCLTC
jgi:hypothetical protein